MSEQERVIRLDQFLKIVGAVGTGGEAKVLIQSGEVLVNGQIDTRRSHKLSVGDQVSLGGRTWVVEVEE